MRTIQELRNSREGKVYMYLANESIGKKFLQDAENEGYMFGDIKPTESHWSDIIAVENDKQLSYVGHIGRINFQCNGGSSGRLTRVDYEKYINGEKDFLYK